jgi:hypothetical protein
MTEQTQPTDAEIEALGHRMCWRYKHDTGVNHISTFTFNAQTLHDFARAVLAKWGTPAGAGELVACTYGDNGYACCEGGPCQADVHNASITTPQPTQAQAGAVPTRAFLERTLAAMEGVIDVADRKTDEFDALRSCVIDLTLMLFSDAKRHTKGADHER